MVWCTTGGGATSLCNAPPIMVVWCGETPPGRNSPGDDQENHIYLSYRPVRRPFGRVRGTFGLSVIRLAEFVALLVWPSSVWPSSWYFWSVSSVWPSSWHYPFGRVRGTFGSVCHPFGRVRGTFGLSVVRLAEFVVLLVCPSSVWPSSWHFWSVRRPRQALFFLFNFAFFRKRHECRMHVE
jgi:hypothetical protein